MKRYGATEQAINLLPGIVVSFHHVDFTVVVFPTMATEVYEAPRGEMSECISSGRWLAF